jgi:hypothetical protein
LVVVNPDTMSGPEAPLCDPVTPPLLDVQVAV